MPDIKWIEKTSSGLYVAHYIDNTNEILTSANGHLLAKGSGAVTLPAVPPTIGGSGGGSGGAVTGGMVKAAVTAVGGSVSAMMWDADTIAGMFNDAASALPNIFTTKNRVACLVGECAQETDWYKTTKEYGGSSSRYAPYYGRGFIQLTWKSNYQAFGKWLVGKGKISDANVFVDNPDLVATKEWAAYTAIFYFENKWKGQTLWQICDSSSSPWSKISRAINRGDPYATSPAWGESIRAQSIDAVMQVTPKPSGGSTPKQVSSGSAQKIVDLEKSYIGSLAYTQGEQRNNITGGYCDCSSLQHYAYKKIVGMEIGGWTGDQQKYGTIVQELKGVAACKKGLNLSSIKLADLIFFDWYPGAYTPTFDHVECYIGNGQMIGHGGIPHMGPTIKDVQSRVSKSQHVIVRRYIK